MVFKPWPFFMLFDLNHVYLLLHSAATYMTRKHAQKTKSPTIESSQRNVKCLLMMNCFPPPPPPQWHTLIFCFIVLIPLKIHWNSTAFIPPSHTVVTPININNAPHGGKPTNLPDNDRCQNDIELYDKYLTWLMPHC